MAPRAFIITLLCLVAPSLGSQQRLSPTAAIRQAKPSTLVRKSVAPMAEVAVGPGGAISDVAKPIATDKAASGSEGKPSEPVPKRLTRTAQKRPVTVVVSPGDSVTVEARPVSNEGSADSTSEDDGGEFDSEHDDEDLMVVGLSKEDAELEHEQRALTKAVQMVQELELSGDADHDKAAHLEHELLNGVKGEKVEEEIIDIEDSVHPGADVDDLIATNAALTTDDFVALERYETGNPNITDLSEVGDHDEDGEEESDEKSETTDPTLAQEGSWQAALAKGPITKLLQMEEGEDLPTARLRELNNTHHFFVGMKANGPNQNTVWPKVNGKVTIKYCKGPGLTDKAWEKFKAGTADLYTVCQDLDFQEVAKDGQGCQIVIKGDSTGCWSHVGFTGGRNELHLQDGGIFAGTCATKGIATHEMLHALGQSHEQSRSDRDTDPNGVKVNIGNLKDSTKANNFNVNNKESTVDDYDIDSIMQYGCSSFAKSGKYTLEAHRRRRWTPTWWTCAFSMGQRDGMTSKDISQLQRMYDCEAAPAPTRRRRWYS